MPGILLAVATLDVAHSLREFVEREGSHRVHTADNIPACLVQIEQAAPPDLVVLDAKLPGGNPLETCAHIARLGIPVLMIAAPEQVDAAYAADAEDVLAGTLSPVILHQKVQRILETATLRSQAKRDYWYRSIVETDVVGIFRTSPDGRFLYANPGLVKILGYSSEQDLMKLDIARDVYLNPQDRVRLIRDELSVENYIPSSVILKRNNGTPIPVIMSIRSILDESGNIQHFEGFVTDNSRRRQAEDEAQSERQFSETLREVTTLLNTSLDTETVLEHIVTGVGRLLPLDIVSIMLIEQDEAYVVRQHGMEHYINVPEMMQCRYPIQDIPIFKRIVDTRKARVISHTQSDPDWLNLQSTTWSQSYIGLPIVVRNTVIGLLNLDSTTPGAFSEADAERMQAFADQAAVALDNARSVQELRAEITERIRAQYAEHRERLMAEALRDTAAALTSTLDTNEVFARILEYIGKVLPHDGASILLEQNGKLELAQQWGLAERSANWSEETINREITGIPEFYLVMERPMPVVIPDTLTNPYWVPIAETSWIRSHIGAPIIIRGKTIGLLNLDSATPNTFNEADAQHLQAFVNQAAIAIENARTVEQLRAEIAERQRAEAAEREQRQLAEALREATTIINSNLQLDNVLTRILETLNRVMPVELCSILLIENGVAHSAQSMGYEKHGQQQMIDNLLLPVNETANLRQMLTTRQPMVIPDTRNYPGWVDIQQDRWVRSTACAPIIVNEAVIGFLNIDNSQPNAFTQADAERLQAFANQVGIAIENARLYESIQQHNRQLEARVAARTAELEQKRAELVAILNSIKEGVVGTIFVPGTHEIAEMHINTTLIEMFGYSVDEWRTYKTLPDNVSQGKFEEDLPTAHDTADEKGVYEIIRQAQRKDKSSFEVAITVTSICNSAGQQIGRVTVYRNVSQERELQARQARFVAAAAHELRSPLTAFKTRLDLAHRKPQDMERHLKLLDETANQMERLVNDLLNQARFEHGLIELHPEQIKLQSFIEHVILMQQPIAEKKNITLQADIISQPVYLMADRDRLNQVLTNLIVNAITYTPENSIVTVRLPPPDSNGVLIQIEDTGTGIAPEHLASIFEPFYRIRKVGQGMGLGLSIAREIVELHGGTISVDSEIGRGTRFNLRFNP